MLAVLQVIRRSNVPSPILDGNMPIAKWGRAETLKGFSLTAEDSVTNNTVVSTLWVTQVIWGRPGDGSRYD